jgi:hypothetical protein
MKIIRRLFGWAVARNDEFGALDLDTARQVVQDYANFLETAAPLPGRIADETRLPHSKLHIKNALGVCINAANEPGLIGHLKNGYLMLSAWQPGVGENIIGVDFSNLDLEADPQVVAESIQLQSAHRDQWNPLIEAEQASLASELRTLGV